jgi:protein required for attachment to host cells
MSVHRKLIYLIADGANARFVRRGEAAGQFVTVRQLDGHPGLAATREKMRAHPPGRSFESAIQMRHAVGRDDAYQRAKAKFAVSAAEILTRMILNGDCDGVVLVAPSRLLPVLRSHLPRNANVVRTLVKDLIKVPDHELSRWLETGGGLLG